MRVVFPRRSASRPAPPRDGPAVRVEALAKRFGDAQAVAGASFEAARGSMTALLGPSGCGKTTILRLIAGFEAPDAGSVSVDGAVVASPTSFTPPERRRVGMVFQDYALFPHLTVRKNVAFGVPRGEGRDRAVDAALDLVGVRPEAERLPHELSGGQQQRVALARALAAKPSVVLLDEPFSNLDADLRQRVRGETRRILREAGATAVFVTHDQDEAFALADAVCIMLRGAVVQCGPPEDVCLSPVSLEAARFLGAANILDGERDGESVTCALGTLSVANAGAPAGAVKVSVRPETIRLRPERGPTVEAEATSVEFRGAYKAVFLRLACGAEVMSIVGVGAGVPIEAGERLRIGVNGPVAVFPPEQPLD